MSDQVTLTSFLIVIAVLLLVTTGLRAVWKDWRTAESVEQWTNEFIVDSGEMSHSQGIRDRMLALKQLRP